MDFYSRQAAARRQTRWLVLAFALSLGTLVLALDAVLFVLFDSAASSYLVLAPFDFARRNPGAAALTTLIILAVLVVASLVKSLQLRRGGGAVARALGGTRVEHGATDPKRKRLLNVVEEMSIASGVPVPEIYVLERETGINAFVAGHTPASSTIAVTQGALDQLSRDELQAVIAHEFSHVLNGDMRLNVQLIGWLFGLFVIALIGRTVLRFSSRARRGAAGVVVAALAIMILGYVGLFCARLIQAAVSRQRERLADASSVQFTRNPQGLKGALLKIAGLGSGSRLTTDAEQVAHMLFAPGLRRLFATHPPLGERIRAVDPRFDPKSLPLEAAAAVAKTPLFEEPGAGGEALVARAVPAAPRELAVLVGNVAAVHIEHAHALHLALPPSLTEFADSPGKGRALVLALLLSHEPDVRERQLASIERVLGPADREVVTAAAPIVVGLDPMLRLPALLQIFPALRRLTLAERKALAGVATDLVNADERVDVFEFCLVQLLKTLLRDEMDARAPHGRLALGDVERELHVLFSVLARLGAPDPAAARRAYEAGMHTVLPMNRPAYAQIDRWPVELSAALGRLEKLQPFAKKALIEGLVRTIAHDDVLSVYEAELLRAVCAVLHCPLPPLLPGLIRPKESAAA